MLSIYIIIIEGLCSLQLYIVYIWIMFDYYYLKGDMLYMSKLNFSLVYTTKHILPLLIWTRHEIFNASGQDRGK